MLRLKKYYLLTALSLVERSAFAGVSVSSIASLYCDAGISIYKIYLLFTCSLIWGYLFSFLVIKQVTVSNTMNESDMNFKLYHGMAPVMNRWWITGAVR